MWFLVAAVLAPGLVPRLEASYGETRVGVSEVGTGAGVGAWRGGNPDGVEGSPGWYDGLASGSPFGPGGGAPTLDLFGGSHSQIPGAINVDPKALSGVRALAEELPFRGGSIGEIVSSGPRSDFLAEASRVLQPGGRLFINSTARNPFGRLPSVAELDHFGFRVVQDAGPLLDRFSNQVFRFTDGTVIPTRAVRTTVLERY